MVYGASHRAGQLGEHSPPRPNIIYSIVIMQQCHQPLGVAIRVFGACHNKINYNQLTCNSEPINPVGAHYEHLVRVMKNTLK